VSNEEHAIPRHGNAGVAFLGVEFGDAFIVIGSVFAGLFVGSLIGVPGYLGVPMGGYFLNKLYVDWRSKSLPGQFRQRLFELGLAGYGRHFRAAEVVLVGDATVINPGSSGLLDELSRRARVAKDGSQGGRHGN